MSDRKRFLTTFLASLLLHVLLGVLTLHLQVMPRFTPAARAAEPAVELLLVADHEVAPEAPESRPRHYTEIPDRLADERPEQADFLAMRDSRAADRLPGGQAGQQPGSEREAEFPQVAIAPENLSGAEGVSLSPAVLVPAPTAAPDRPEPRSAVPAPPDGAEASGPGDVAVHQPRQTVEDDAQERTEAGDRPDWLVDPSTPSLLKEGRRQSPGDRGFDFRQLEQSRVGASVNIDGDFSLSTYEWNFAPWMRRFANDLHRAWIAPYAYRLGVIDGYTRIRLVVERDGRTSRLEVVDSQGHDSLHTASVSALRAFAPYAPLPPDFPEDHLVILLGLHYPAWKR